MIEAELNLQGIILQHLLQFLLLSTVLSIPVLMNLPLNVMGFFIVRIRRFVLVYINRLELQLVRNIFTGE